MTAATKFLASVVDPAEAALAVRHGADIIDCKNPDEGALGALPVATVSAIRADLPSSTVVSATIGDLPSEPATVLAAARAMAASGCDIVKVGFFPGGEPRATISALGTLTGGRLRVVGLLLADHAPDLSLIEPMAEAGFSGVMVDTAGKAGGGLRHHMSPAALAAFIATARARGLFSGLAGSLRLSDVDPLMRLKPNVLGFRGALCAGSVRTGALSAPAVAGVRSEMDRVRRLLQDAGVGIGTLEGSVR